MSEHEGDLLAPGPDGVPVTVVRRPLVHGTHDHSLWEIQSIHVQLATEHFMTFGEEKVLEVAPLARLPTMLVGDRSERPAAEEPDRA